MNISRYSLVVAAASVLLAAPAMSSPVLAQPAAKTAPAMERSEHEWKGGGASSTFDALWSGRKLKMIREELRASDGMIEKNEYMFNQGALLHYKQDRYPAEGKKGPEEATMVSFDKSERAIISMRKVDGNAAGPASTAAIAAAKKHLAELLAITGRVRR